MIIISQNEKLIINNNNITLIYIEFVEYEKIKYRLTAEMVTSSEIILGEYKTEERSKEILQEIVRKYKLGTNKIKIKTSRGAEIVERNIIYEMPKEWNTNDSNTKI